MKCIKFIIALAAVSALSAPAIARGGYSSGHSYSAHSSGGVHTVRSYVRKDGTFVHSYRATNANGTRNDNFSTRGNLNPYTGKPGTKPRDGEGN